MKPEKMVDTLPKLDGIVHCAGIGQRILCKQLQETDVDNVTLGYGISIITMLAEGEK